eukprot:CAMPEP_0170077316 /NCGR_PEP_ID=MMETSP0019_2-20121128/14156_1 /TAXON_ID=98059 /ORGANISM="Dinobryon sp., Strain UTEXLB2267" /LENGTH=1791 /DNA_ID=CAMNT_0010289569 /DNA_START=144 /DNA_END=5519 /DNA_ORIENTATION=-
MSSSKYSNSDSDLDDNYEKDEEEQKISIPFVQSSVIVDKVLGRKVIKNSEIENDDTIEELFLIKWRNLSYLHASWERRQDIENVDPHGKTKLKRFMMMPHAPGIIGEQKISSSSGEGELDDEEDSIDYFHPDLLEVQRVISCDTPSCWHSTAKSHDLLLINPIVKTTSSQPVKKKYVANKDDEEAEWDDEDEDVAEEIVHREGSDSNVKYLVKWRGLPYSECSWEKWSDITSFSYQVWKFWQVQKAPPLPIKKPRFPSLQEYQKLAVSPVFGIDGNITEIEGSSSTSVGLRLRDYQLEGINWLLWNWWHKRPCILADEMGLGKTIQTIGFIHQLRHMRCTQMDGPFLIIAPLSLVNQWQSEIATWAPDLNCVMLHGSAEARELVVNHEFYFQEPFCAKSDAAALKKANKYKFHVLLTTFEMAMKDMKVLSRIQWQVMIVDEAHKLKNQQSRLFQSLSLLPREYCVLLTGTPLQNKTEELWALLNFADPKRFDNLEDFVSNFGDLKDSVQVAKLHNVLKPYLLRRIKEDVEKSLPPKEETIVEVALTSVQKRYYRAIYEKNTAFLFKGVKSSNQPSLMNVMMELRKCCNHPYLVKGVEDRILAELTAEEANNPQIVYQKFIESSGKLVLLDKLLPKLYTQGHKVLIFSQMVRVLNIIEDFLKFKNYSFERLDGSTASNDRKDAVERFCKPSMNRFIMLLSTKAGGLGLNLTAADTVIIFDSDWNPQNDLQAQARAHRIGQTKAVMVYRLLTRKTYEMEMFHQASMKLGLDRAVLAHARNEEAGGDGEICGVGGATKAQLSAIEIDVLLKRGAYDVFREDDTEQKEFVEADIDSILQRRAHKVVYEKNGTGGAASLGSFSKASFVSKDEKEDVDINDPDFWQKAVGLTKDSTSVLDNPAFDEFLPQQRSRKQTKSYNENQILDAALKDILKPLSSSKSSKSVGDKKVKKEDMTKEELKDWNLKEKQERDELRLQKALLESKTKSDPNNWGAHSRDRTLRALTLYGFGRWEKIRSETKYMTTETSQIESFCRAFILQCGLSASEQEPSRQDSDFVRDAISAATAVNMLVRSGQRQLEIPQSITEDKFVAKLKAGQAKKSLNKLDALAKLHHIMLRVADDAFKDRFARGITSEVEGKDLDALMAMLTVDEMCQHISVGLLRPTWAVLRPWWDITCDRHLLLGIFKHGYGRFDLIRDDPLLIFESKLKQAIEDAGGTEFCAGDVASATLDHEEDSKVPTARAKKSKKVAVEDSKAPPDGNDFQDQDNYDDVDMAIGPTKTTAYSSSAWVMPDARLMNRLFIWLVSTNASKEESMQQEEAASQKTAGGSKRGVKEISESSNIRADSDEHSFAINSELIDRTKKLYEDDYLFANLNELLDVECMNLVYKPNVMGIRRCEGLLWASVAAGDKVDDGRMDVDSQGFGFSAEDSIRLSAVFIVFGAPLTDAKSVSLPRCVRECMGCGPTTMPSTSWMNSYSWEDVVKWAGISQSAALASQFYDTIWLPFCNSISTRKPLSHSQHKLLLPNPMSELADHSFGSRGLCHLFLLRQQLRMSVHFVLANALPRLLDYLKSPFGRSVDHMPVWWCPWIHDLAVLVAIVKYGYLNQLSLLQIMEDDELPFERKHLEEHIRRVFLYGNHQLTPVCVGEVGSIEAAESFVQLALLQFPDYRELEVRALRVMQDMTRLLSVPRESPVRILSYSLFNSTASSNSISDNVQSTMQDKLENADGESSKAVSVRILDMGLKHPMSPSLLPRKLSVESIREAFTLDTGCKIPPLPLRQFVRASKRRRLAVFQNRK